jgi:hypothetical protein
MDLLRSRAGPENAVLGLVLIRMLRQRRCQNRKSFWFFFQKERFLLPPDSTAGFYALVRTECTGQA